jgi:hypothetical protein
MERTGKRIPASAMKNRELPPGRDRVSWRRLFGDLKIRAMDNPELSVPVGRNSELRTPKFSSVDRSCGSPR